MPGAVEVPESEPASVARVSELIEDTGSLYMALADYVLEVLQVHDALPAMAPDVATHLPAFARFLGEDVVPSDIDTARDLLYGVFDDLYACRPRSTPNSASHRRSWC